MNHYRKFYKALDQFLKKDLWQLIKDQRVIGVEIPSTKIIYYVNVDVNDLKAKDFSIDVVKGNLGLRSLREVFDPNPRLIDRVKRSDFIHIGFTETKATVEAVTEDHLHALKAYHYESFEILGYPSVFYKVKGHTLRAIDPQLASDLALVFKVLTEVPFGPLKNIAIDSKHKVVTLFKAKGWQMEARKIDLQYPKVKYSGLEIYPVMKKTKKINDLWHMTSFYKYFTMDDDKMYRLDEAPPLHGDVNILDPNGQPMSAMDFVGPREELPAMKALLLKVINTYGVRPKTLSTNLRSLYYGLKDFAKALDITLVYEPKDLEIIKFSQLVFDSNKK